MFRIASSRYGLGFKIVERTTSLECPDPRLFETRARIRNKCLCQPVKKQGIVNPRYLLHSFVYTCVLYTMYTTPSLSLAQLQHRDRYHTSRKQKPPKCGTNWTLLPFPESSPVGTRNCACTVRPGFADLGWKSEQEFANHCRGPHHVYKPLLPHPVTTQPIRSLGRGISTLHHSTSIEPPFLLTSSASSASPTHRVREDILDNVNVCVCYLGT